MPQKEVVPVPAATPAPGGSRVEQAQNLVSGTVFESSRARIPGVEISIADPVSKEAMTTVFTDIKGDFSFAVPVGQNVELTFRSAGFTPVVVKNVAGGQPPWRIVLNLGMISVTVTITAASLPEEPAGASATRKVQPIRIGGNVHPPKLIRRVDPVYPVEARRQGIEGIVLLQVYVGLGGEVLDARVIKGQPPLDDAAIEAVRQWQYTPYLLNGEPQPGITAVTLIFKLDKQ
jgi:TonB family protein